MASKGKTKAKFATVDDYLATLSSDKRAALQRLRKIIRAAAPGVEECISYQLPAFRLDGKYLMWLGAGANHCAIYGATGATKKELAGYYAHCSALDDSLAPLRRTSAQAIPSGNGKCSSTM